MASPRRHQGLSPRHLLADERGTVYKDAPCRVALVYPSPYRAAMSSLGYQTIYRLLNEEPDIAADRAVLPDDPAAARRVGVPLCTLERETPLGDYPILLFSVAFELELAGVIDCLELAGIPALASERPERAPIVIAGGPLTFSNPAPLAPFVDAVALGEGEQLALDTARLAREVGYDRDRLLADLGGREGYYVPARDGDSVPAIAQADTEFLPARSQIVTPHAELSSMYLTEAARGCSRGCTYCVMRRSTNGGMRIIDPETILAGIPEDAPRVGLVGAAVTDHPKIEEIVRGVVEGGREVGISSLRADKLTDELVGLLARGGYKTLTVASDGASESLRRQIERSTTEKHLIRTAELARDHGLSTVKLYMMVGLPDETDDDIDELARFIVELGKIHPRVALGVAPFVAKRNTPLDGADFAGIRVVDSRLARLRKRLRGRAVVRPTSARWAWVEYMLAQGTGRAGMALLEAHRQGGKFSDYRRAFDRLGCAPTGPVARVPSSSELVALKRNQLRQRRAKAG